MKKEEWKDYLKEEDIEMITEMRIKTRRGLAVGTAEFIEGLEDLLKRSLNFMGPGRPRKKGR